MKNCCFIGHKNCGCEIKENLLNTVKKLIVENNVKNFYVGTQGNFDRLVYEVLCILQNYYEIEIFIVLAYLNRNTDNVYYDCKKTIFPDVLTKTPMRFAIRRRNSYIIDISDYVITYVNNQFSNTFINIEEAIRKKKCVINLGELNLSSVI